MKKTLVYALDALSPSLVYANLKNDIENEEINKIIIPTFILKASAIKYKSFPKLIYLLKDSPKIEIADFPVLYHEVDDLATNDYLLLFMQNISKKYENMYLRTRKDEIRIEFLKRGYKVYLDKEFDDKISSINFSNSINPISNIVLFDTCFLVKAFDNEKGLNILTDFNIKKVILSCVLEELIKIGRSDVFKFIINFINKKDIYNFELIITSNAYNKVIFYNDITLLSYFIELQGKKEYENMVLYTLDIELFTQSLAMGIKTSGEELSKLAVVKTKETQLNGYKEDTENLDTNNVAIYSETTSNSNDLMENEQKDDLSETNSSIPQNSLPISVVIKRTNVYMPADEVIAVYKDLTTGLYSSVCTRGKKRYYKIKLGYNVKLKNEKFAFKISKIDTDKQIAYLTETTFKI